MVGAPPGAFAPGSFAHPTGCACIAPEDTSKTGMPAPVLAAIGGGALLATGRGRTVVIRIGAGQGPRTIVVDVAEPGDVAMGVVMMVMMPVAANMLIRLGQDRRGDHGYNKGRGAKQFQSDHL